MKFIEHSAWATSYEKLVGGGGGALNICNLGQGASRTFSPTFLDSIKQIAEAALLASGSKNTCQSSKNPHLYPVAFVRAAALLFFEYFIAPVGKTKMAGRLPTDEKLIKFHKNLIDESMKFTLVWVNKILVNDELTSAYHLIYRMCLWEILENSSGIYYTGSDAWQEIPSRIISRIPSRSDLYKEEDESLKEIFMGDLISENNIYLSELIDKIIDCNRINGKSFIYEIKKPYSEWDRYTSIGSSGKKRISPLLAKGNLHGHIWLVRENLYLDEISKHLFVKARSAWVSLLLSKTLAYKQLANARDWERDGNINNILFSLDLVAKTFGIVIPTSHVSGTLISSVTSLAELYARDIDSAVQSTKSVCNKNIRARIYEFLTTTLDHKLIWSDDLKFIVYQWHLCDTVFTAEIWNKVV